MSVRPDRPPSHDVLNMAPEGFPPPETGPEHDPLLSVTMTAEAADRFAAALSYAEAVVHGKADANPAPDTKAKIEEHGDWLRWGIGRIATAKMNGAA